jgi:hypothetical protein
MPLTAGQLIALAAEAAHSPGKIAQALNLLNSILSDLCQERDFAEARGQFLFHFTPSGRPSATPVPQEALWGSAIWGEALWTASPDTLATEWGLSRWGESLWGVTGTIPPVPLPPPAPIPQPNISPSVQFGSGPYTMPLDYLRLSGSSGSHGSQRSFIWWLDGVPYPVIPVDLAEFDMQVQQTGLQSYVWLAATDMSAPIDDRILLQTTADVVAGSTYLVNIASTARLVGGNVLGVAGQGIVPGTMLTAVPSAPAVPQLSQPAIATIYGASIFFGYCPVIFVYPPPIGTQQAMIRYQKQMPALVDMTRFPWMHNDRYLLTALTGRLCGLNDDARADTLNAGAEDNLTNFLSMKDDEQSHPKKVELDRRVFGRQISNLGITKRVGW